MKIPVSTRIHKYYKLPTPVERWQKKTAEETQMKILGKKRMYCQDVRMQADTERSQYHSPVLRINWRHHWRTFFFHWLFSEPHLKMIPLVIHVQDKWAQWLIVICSVYVGSLQSLDWNH